MPPVWQFFLPALLTFFFFICTVGTTLILFEGLPLEISRTITVGGIAVAVGGASAVDGIIGAIGIAAAGGSCINPVRACLSSS